MVTYGLRELLMTLACHTDGTLLIAPVIIRCQRAQTGASREDGGAGTCVAGRGAAHDGGATDEECELGARMERLGRVLGGKGAQHTRPGGGGRSASEAETRGHLPFWKSAWRAYELSMVQMSSAEHLELKDQERAEVEVELSRTRAALASCSMQRDELARRVAELAGGDAQTRAMLESHR